MARCGSHRRRALRRRTGKGGRTYESQAADGVPAIRTPQSDDAVPQAARSPIVDPAGPVPLASRVFCCARTVRLVENTHSLRRSKPRRVSGQLP